MSGPHPVTADSTKDELWRAVCILRGENNRLKARLAKAEPIVSAIQELIRDEAGR